MYPFRRCVRSARLFATGCIAAAVILSCSAESSSIAGGGSGAASAGGGGSGGQQASGTGGGALAGSGNSGGYQASGTGGAAGDPVSSGSAGTAGGPVEPPLDPNEVPTECIKDVDLVFVLDVSLSMNIFMQKLIDEIMVVDAAVQQLGTPNPPHYGLVVFVDDVECTNNCQPYADALATQQALNDWYLFVSTDFLTGNNQLHNTDPADKNYSWPENSLDALHAAATGFPWRPLEETVRMIIHSTDASFWDIDVASSNDTAEPIGTCAPGWENFPLPGNMCLTTGSQHGYMETIEVLRQNGIWVNSFAAPVGGPPDIVSAAMFVYRGTAVDVSPGFFTPYDNQQTIPLSTGGDVWDVLKINDGTVSLSDCINSAIVEKQGCDIDYPDEIPPIE